MSPRARTLFLTLNGWLLAFCLGYVVTALSLPRPAYFPLEHRWALAFEAPGVSMLYYGQVLWALLFGLAGAAIGAGIGRVGKVSLEACILLSGWTGVILLVTLMFNAFQVFR